MASKHVTPNRRDESRAARARRNGDCGHVALLTALWELPAGDDQVDRGRRVARHAWRAALYHGDGFAPFLGTRAPHRAFCAMARSPPESAPVFFAFEFVLIYGGLAHTNASRMSVFVYLRPAAHRGGPAAPTCRATPAAPAMGRRARRFPAAWCCSLSEGSIPGCIPGWVTCAASPRAAPGPQPPFSFARQTLRAPRRRRPLFLSTRRVRRRVAVLRSR